MTALFQQPFQSLAGLPVIAFVTTRQGGVSSPPFDTLNLAYLTADDRQAVRQNRDRLAAALEVDHDDLLIGRQVHGATVNRAEDIVLGETAGDAIVLTSPGTVAMLVVADCLPLILYDPATHVGAIAHAGWRGLAAGLLDGVVDAMRGNGARAEDIRVGIGPAIGPCCYEVGPEVVSAVGAQESERRPGSGDRAFLDLAAVANRQLQIAGITPRQVEDVGECTRCASDVYFSARAGEPTGRFAAGLKLLQTWRYNQVGMRTLVQIGCPRRAGGSGHQARDRPAKWVHDGNVARHRATARGPDAGLDASAPGRAADRDAGDGDPENNSTRPKSRR